MTLVKKTSAIALILGILSIPGLAQASGTWSATGTLHNGRFGATAVLLGNGKALLAGGVDSANNVLASAEMYDPASGMWSSAGSLNIARQMYLATLLPNGKVLIVGG